MLFRSQSRLINLYTDISSDVSFGHILAEVLNPESGAWELIDPDIYVWYEKDGRRIGIEEAVKLGPENFVACNATGCSWLNQNREGVKADILRADDYFGAGYHYASEQQAPMLHISSRFDHSIVFKDHGKTIVQRFKEAGIPITFH